MSNAADNNGNQPLTQQTRDSMAQNDHDEIVRQSVMLQTIMTAQTRLEQQIKDLIQGQATALAAWEAQNRTFHDAQDTRLRKLEDIGTQWLPRAIEYETWRDKIGARLEVLEDGKIAFFGGWKAVIFIVGGFMGIISFIFMISQILCAFSCHLR